jgi:hypothetical protein
MLRAPTRSCKQSTDICVCVWSAAVQSDYRAWPSAGAECPITRGGLSTSETRRQRLPCCVLPSLARTCSPAAPRQARQASASSPIAAERGASLNPPPTCRSVAMTRCARPPWPSSPSRPRLGLPRTAGRLSLLPRCRGACHHQRSATHPYHA